MSSDWSLELALDEHKQAQRKQMAVQAAILVVEDRQTRGSAVEAVKNRSYEQEDAITKGRVLDNPNGDRLEYDRPELNDRSIPTGKEPQVAAIAAQILDESD